VSPLLGHDRLDRTFTKVRCDLETGEGISYFATDVESLMTLTSGVTCDATYKLWSLDTGSLKESPGQTQCFYHRWKISSDDEHAEPAVF